MFLKKITITCSLILFTGVFAQMSMNPLKEAKMQAEKENKLVLVEFYADWCSICKKFEAKTLADKSVRMEIDKKYILVRVDAEKQEQDFVISQKIKSYPNIYIIDQMGKVVKSKKGFMKKDEFLTFIK